MSNRKNTRNIMGSIKPVTQTAASPSSPMTDVPHIQWVGFADSKIPVFKESRNKDYIKYGEDNLYPNYLTTLFDKSAKHGAIVSGKAFYIFGKGFDQGNIIVNRLGETLNDVADKCILDQELYGGWRLEIIWNAAKKVKEIYHIDYTTIRVGKNGGYYWKESWEKDNRDEELFIPEFDPNNPVGSQIYSYTEYRPKTRFYPLPAYVGCNNYIETDIEVSKYYLSAIRNGMTPSKMIQFFKGEPAEEKKREIEYRMNRKFSGAENAGKMLLVFNDANATNPVQVDDLSATDLDKHMIELNKTCQQEIFSGHKVTSPMLFGIKTEGQLGGNTELKASYELFQNTYAKKKADIFGKKITYLMSFSTQPGEYVLQPTDPVGWAIPETLLAQAITPDDVREKLGLPIAEKSAGSDSTKTLTAINGMSPLVATKLLEKLTDNEIRALAGLAPIAGGDRLPAAEGQPANEVVSPELDSDEDPIIINDNIKNLTGKQLLNIERVIKKYKQGKLTLEIAKHMLRTGYGLSDTEVDQFLGIKSTVQMDSDDDDDAIVEIFDEYGESREDYEVHKAKAVAFSIDDAEEEEDLLVYDAFKALTKTEKKIVELISKDPLIPPTTIAEALKLTKKYVNGRITKLVRNGIIETAVEALDGGNVVTRLIPKVIDIIGDDPPVNIQVMYSYEVKPGIGPAIIPTTRPFCKKMIQLDRLYSRADIEKISLRLGYSVWDRKGGFWGKSKECRHRWVANLVTKK